MCGTLRPPGLLPLDPNQSSQEGKAWANSGMEGGGEETDRSLEGRPWRAGGCLLWFQPPHPWPCPLWPSHGTERSQALEAQHLPLPTSGRGSEQETTLPGYGLGRGDLAGGERELRGAPMLHSGSRPRPQAADIRAGMRPVPGSAPPTWGMQRGWAGGWRIGGRKEPSPPPARKGQDTSKAAQYQQA